MPAPKIVSELTEVLDAAHVSHRLNARLHQAGAPGQELAVEAGKRGYTAAAGPKAELGIKQTIRADGPVQPPTGSVGQPVQEVEFELALRAFRKQGGNDEAAVGTVSITAGTQSETYDMLLEAPDGDFAQAKEWKLEGNKVVEAQSWWDAVVNCIYGTCAPACVNALIGCKGTWTEYLSCIFRQCGVCWLKCAGCATCNCGWWCNWAAGCCRQ